MWHIHDSLQLLITLILERMSLFLILHEIQSGSLFLFYSELLLIDTHFVHFLLGFLVNIRENFLDV